jgi:AbrB family looped-hinge helix DNA binding protein
MSAWPFETVLARFALITPECDWKCDSRWGFQALYSYQHCIDGQEVMQSKDTAKLSAKFQISIPKAIRTARRWEAGQIFAFIPKGEGMLLMPVPPIDELAGIARGADPQQYRDRSDRT